MLISDSHEFIFVRVRKTASQSMCAVLNPFVLPRPDSLWARFISRSRLALNYRRYRFRAHEELRVARRLMPRDAFERYFKFAIVRNPWGRLVSEYEFLLQSPTHGRYARARGGGSFEAFVDMQIPRRDAYQATMLCDRKGNLLTDFVGRMETLADDWKTICENIGIPHEELPRKNVSAKRPYTEYYTPALRDRVAKHWAREIELFGYEFE